VFTTGAIFVFRTLFRSMPKGVPMKSRYGILCTLCLARIVFDICFVLLILWDCVPPAELFERLKDEYYAIRKWDVKTGHPTRSKLQELKLNYIAEDLVKRKTISS